VPGYTSEAIFAGFGVASNNDYPKIEIFANGLMDRSPGPPEPILEQTRYNTIEWCNNHVNRYTNNIPESHYMKRHVRTPKFNETLLSGHVHLPIPVLSKRIALHFPTAHIRQLGLSAHAWARLQNCTECGTVVSIVVIEERYRTRLSVDSWACRSEARSCFRWRRRLGFWCCQFN
jgi:hypothetical protein